jgi:hypothetical protein
MNELTTMNESPLSDDEQNELAECEAVIEAGLQEFVKVGNALLYIRDHKLYRQKHATFEDYCKARWKFSDRRGRQLIKAAEVVQNLQSGQKPEPEVPNSEQNANNVVNTTAPSSEKQTRHLAGLPKDQQQQAWTIATANAKDPAKPTEVEVKAEVEQTKENAAQQVKVKETGLKIVEYLRAKKHDGATSDQIEMDTGVAHQRVSDLLKSGDAVYQTEGGKRIRRATANGKKATAYVIVLAEFGEEKKPSKPKSNEPDVRSGQPAKPEDHVPIQLLGQGKTISEKQLVQGYAVSNDVAGQPCCLPIGTSKLERDERVATTIGGSEAFKDRRAYYKWERYKEKKIREKVLKVLEQMSPLEIPKGFKVTALTYQYNLGVASDLQELADMLYADLTRQASALKNREKYGHLYPDALK